MKKWHFTFWKPACTSPAHDGPLGRTTLHAAVIVHNYGNVYLFFSILQHAWLSRK